ncbi:APC family permease [Mycoplasmopsis agassizii]|uniref:Amino acid permease n=1 Tax=Mycoplasmopsis agassizii TaxID=33922 RepID=A0ABX4H4N4_9BACT|nr:APC family permease [Mycoplasmopsis agassizii]PAF54845.1 amino acid permease [Mycoplasmopsis agassizii]SMC18607.1 Amino acid transporter [Mycoplasmopsis agassizii]
MKQKETDKAKAFAKKYKKKKISFFSAMLLVLGSSIGAGIFFKSETVLSMSQNSLILSFFSWIIAAVAVIAMALALIEVASAKRDNLSLISWNKVFNSRTVFKASKNFMVFIYLPLAFFFVPFYIISSLQDGLGAIVYNQISAYRFNLGVDSEYDWLIWALIAFLLAIYFIIFSGLSSKLADWQNKIIVILKFIPIVFIVIVGFIVASQYPSNTSALVQRPTDLTIASGASIVRFAPGLGLFISLGAIFYAFDGFYVLTGVQSELENPKKAPLALFLGLVIVTVINLSIAIAMTINGGSFFLMADKIRQLFGTNSSGQNVGIILFGIVNIIIATSIMGILNSFSVWSPRYLEELIAHGEIPFSAKLRKTLNSDKPWTGVKYSLVLVIPFFIIFTLIGALGYINTYSNRGYDEAMAKLYSFADLIANWVTVFTFMFIIFSIYGAIVNRRKNFIKVEKIRCFLLFAWIAVATVFLSLAVTLLLPIIDFFLIPQLESQLMTNYSDEIISRVLLVVVLLIFVFFTFGYGRIEDLLMKKKFKNFNNYKIWKARTFNLDLHEKNNF